jgi:hypothetical protein
MNGCRVDHNPAEMPIMIRSATSVSEPINMPVTICIRE